MLDTTAPAALRFPSISETIAPFMPRVAPAARTRVVIEAVSGLQRLQREMARLPQSDKYYESQRRALNATIRELRGSLSGRESHGPR
jgi:hypothetical protein